MDKAPARNTPNPLPALGVFALMLLLWQLVVKYWEINPQTLPAPTQIISSALADMSALGWASLYTSVEVLSGLAIACLGGISLGALIASRRWANRVGMPLIVASQTIPIIAIAPLIIRWAGFGIQGKIALVAIYASLPIIIATTHGVRTLGQSGAQVAFSLGAKPSWVLLHVKLPAALPSIIAGIKISATYAFGTAATAEYVGAQYGLGTYLNVAKNSFRTDLVFAATFTLAGLTLILFSFIWLLERILIPWNEEDRT
ncbi:ABC transporter permease [Actinomycetaceae bacterium TAE3-ERU4]|nr:ABC transporter permease [Actinomycetaceae bacterium TAE3-ERU4]